MIASVFRSVAMWTMLLCAANAQNAPILKSYGQLVYPPIAKAARIEGTVTVEFLLDQQGRVASISSPEGNTMLAKAAESFVKTWQFELEGLASATKVKYRTTIHFKLIHGVVDPRDSSSVNVHSDSFRDFEVTALIGDVELSKCPTAEDVTVPAEKAPDDFVEISSPPVTVHAQTTR